MKLKKLLKKFDPDENIAINDGGQVDFMTAKEARSSPNYDDCKVERITYDDGWHLFYICLKDERGWI